MACHKKKLVRQKSLQYHKYDAFVAIGQSCEEFPLENKISVGHARALLAITDGEAQFDMAEHVIDEECSVRETEVLVKKFLEPEEETTKPEKEVAALVNKRELEDSLKSIFATKVKISAKTKRKN